jgi:hypothetical protein
MTGANLTAATSEGADAHPASDAIWPMRRNKALWRAAKPIPDCRPGNAHRTVMAASSVASISFRRFRNGFLECVTPGERPIAESPAPLSYAAILLLDSLRAKIVAPLRGKERQILCAAAGKSSLTSARSLPGRRFEAGDSAADHIAADTPEVCLHHVTPERWPGAFASARQAEAVPSILRVFSRWRTARNLMRAGRRIGRHEHHCGRSYGYE